MSSSRHNVFTPKILSAILPKILAAAILLSLPTILPAAPAANVGYDNGSLINLTTLRGVIATASDNLLKDHPSPDFLLHKAEGEIRFDSHFGPCWWMMQLPDDYNISDVRLSCRDVITSAGFQIKAAEKLPADWSRLTPVATFLGPLDAASAGSRTAQLHFNPVNAKFLRIEFLGHNGGEHGAGSGHSDLVIHSLQVWGPNDPEINPAISLAQSAWADSSCTLHDSTTDDRLPDGTIVAKPPVNCPAAIDDNDPTAPPGNNSIVTFFAPGSPAAPSNQTATPATFIVTLKNRARILAVGYSSATPDRVEQPRDISIYTSPNATGTDWTLHAKLADVRAPGYLEIPLDHPAPAQRVRFDIDRVWNPNIDPNRHAAEGHLSQLYIYANGLPPDIQFTATEPCQAACRIFDSRGNPIRNLQYPHAIQPGPHGLSWDGLDDSGAPMPPGRYQARVTLNPAIYTNVGNIGNTAQPPTIDQNPTQIESIAADSDGNIYSANLWDEAAQDFRKWDRNTGQHVFDAHGLIRSGNPNALAYAIAVDDKFIYCATTSHTNHAQQHLRRFNLSDGSPAPFPSASETAGHILIHDNPEEEIPPGTSQATADFMKKPLRGIAVAGNRLFVTDALAGKVLIFDRDTGTRLSSFDVNLPAAIAADSRGQLWVAHDNTEISVFSPDGRLIDLAHSGLGQIRALAFAPGDILCVADSAAGKILFFPPSGQPRTLGQPATPGDFAPDHFFPITGLAVDSHGYITVAQKLPVDGARLTRFSPDGKLIWDQIGGEFCTIGTLSPSHPNEIISQLFHRYILNSQTGQWDFRGSVLDGDPQFVRWPHGPMRIQKLGNTEFLFQSYGDGLQVYRRHGDLFRLCSMFGCVNPLPTGLYRDAMTIPEEDRPLKRLWSWHDSNGDGKVDDTEITWEQNLGESVDWDNFGTSVDSHGNALLCEFNNSITEVPITGFDPLGNPIYDLFARHTVIPADHSDNAILSDPIMAIRADDGSIYVHSRSKIFPAPDNSGSWMTGWMLARYDKDGNRLWYTRLPEPCPGMDVIPGGGGVILVAMKWGQQGSPIYHYAPDGSLIGITHPSPALRGIGGIPDNTGSLTLSRNPRDQTLDLFVEDCIDNHFRWFRINDHKKPTSLTIPILLSTHPTQ